MQEPAQNGRVFWFTQRDSANNSPLERSEAFDSRGAGFASKLPVTRSKSKSSRSASAAPEKDAQRRQKALEKQFAKAQQQAEAAKALPVPIASNMATTSKAQEFLPLNIQQDQLNWSPNADTAL